MILVCGPSGSGKSTAISTFIEARRGYEHIIASEILSSFSRPLSNDMSAADAAENQKVLSLVLKKVLRKEEIVFDGHLLVRHASGVFLLSETFFDGVECKNIFFFGHISRSNEGEPCRKSMEAELEFTYAKWLASAIGAAFDFNLSGDKARNAAIMLASISA